MEKENKIKKCLSFDKCREFVHTLNLKSKTEYELYFKSGKTNTIPSTPSRTYKNDGWISWSDFLGTKIGFSGFLPIEEAKKITHQLELKSQLEWFTYCKSGQKPNNIPVKPQNTYKNNGWISWDDWLNCKIIHNFNKNFIPLDEAKNIIHSLNLKTKREYDEYYKLNLILNVSPSPDQYYNDWISWGDFLGTGRISNTQKKKNWLPFNEVLEIIHKLKLNSINDYWDYCRSGGKPINIPLEPNIIYKDKGWISWGHFLGTNKMTNKERNGQYASLDDAKAFIHKLNIKSQVEWWSYVKTGNKPDNIPYNPERYYKNNR